MNSSARLAHELAMRFRVVARALDRLDRLEGERAFAGWLEQLGERPEVLRAVSEALLRQTLHAAASEVNLALLRQLRLDEATPLATLAGAVGLDRLALYLRLGELAHAGLVALELEREAARLTSLGEAMLTWLDELLRCTEERIAEWLELVRSTRP